jgi:antirestriction protein ArdC
MQPNPSFQPQPNSDLYAAVTGQIIAAIAAGQTSFSLPWRSVCGLPTNLASQRPYRGINTVLLWLVGGAKGYASPYWATYRQWLDLGCPVRAGEKAATVVFWKPLAARDEGSADPAQDSDGRDGRRPFVARAYQVFNGAP